LKATDDLSTGNKRGAVNDCMIERARTIGVSKSDHVIDTFNRNNGCGRSVYFGSDG
jgi:hypothetical protein